MKKILSFIIMVLFIHLAMSAQEVSKPSKEPIFEQVEQPPIFPGGESAMKAYLAANIQYPQEAFEKKIEGRVVVGVVVKKDGLIFISYCMNEYAIITHGFKENYIKETINSLDNNFNIISKDNDLYSFVRLKDINKLNKECKLKRIKIISQDGPTEYLKKEINKMDNKTFDIFLNYHFKTCESKYLLEASRHTLDILKKV